MFRASPYEDSEGRTRYRFLDEYYSNNTRQGIINSAGIVCSRKKNDQFEFLVGIDRDKKYSILGGGVISHDNNYIYTAARNFYRKIIFDGSDDSQKLKEIYYHLKKKDFFCRKIYLPEFGFMVFLIDYSDFFDELLKEFKPNNEIVTLAWCFPQECSSICKPQLVSLAQKINKQNSGVNWHI